MSSNIILQFNTLKTIISFMILINISCLMYSDGYGLICSDIFQNSDIYHNMCIDAWTRHIIYGWIRKYYEHLRKVEKISALGTIIKRLENYEQLKNNIS